MTIEVTDTFRGRYNWVANLHEVGDPVLDRVRRYNMTVEQLHQLFRQMKAMEAELTALGEEIEAKAHEHWTPEEIAAAREEVGG
ncbi:MAG: hypothetical protein HQL72_04245 [Magnetococcales bacterium]|nr:hypothetical protein [Magnetococcales bacterium]